MPIYEYEDPDDPKNQDPNGGPTNGGFFEFPNPELDELDKIYNSATLPSFFSSLSLVSR